VEGATSVIALEYCDMCELVGDIILWISRDVIMDKKDLEC